MTDWADMLADVQANAVPAAFQKGRLAADWVVPPFSVLNTLSGEWRDRKASWLALGIESEVGRDDGTKVMNAQARMNEVMRCRCGTANTRTGDKTVSDPSAHAPDCPAATDDGGYAKLSIFDPVLCEIAYRWWCPEGGSILDPFAGGSVRGVVAALLGHPYTGIDLSATQVAANREQAKRLVPGDKPMPRWYVGDSLEVLPDLPAGELYDMVFTCPPYYDLEVYSTDPADLSAKPTYGAFLEAYNEIIASAVRRLRKHRLGVVVVSDVRDPKTGYVQPLTRDTELAFERADAGLWTSGVLVNTAGTLALRQQRHMSASRKLGRMHQDVLVFANGAPDSKGWSYAREAPPPPQQSLGWDVPDDRPVQPALDLVADDAVDVQRVTADDLMDDADLGDYDCHDCDHAEHLPDTCGAPNCVCGMVGDPASPPTTAQDGPQTDDSPPTPPAAPAPAVVAPAPAVVAPAPRADPPPPWAKWLPPDDTPAQHIGPLGQTSKAPAQTGTQRAVVAPADLSDVKPKARADLCEQCGQPRGPGHPDHQPWVTPQHAADLYAAGVWAKADATDDDVAAMQGAGLWEGME